MFNLHQSSKGPAPHGLLWAEVLSVEMVQGPDKGSMQSSLLSQVKTQP